MWKRRIIWLALLLGALIFYLFENNGRTLAALLLCGLAPPVSFLYAYFRCRNASIQITAPERISCGTAADCMIRSSAEGNTTLYIENLHNGEEEQYPLTLKKGDNSFKLHTDCCGAVEFRIQGMEARDLFGLFSHKISREARQQVIVIPNLFPVEILSTGNCPRRQEKQSFGRWGFPSSVRCFFDTRRGRIPGLSRRRSIA